MSVSELKTFPLSLSERWILLHNMSDSEASFSRRVRDWFQIHFERIKFWNKLWIEKITFWFILPHKVDNSCFLLDFLYYTIVMANFQKKSVFWFFDSKFCQILKWKCLDVLISELKFFHRVKIWAKFLKSHGIWKNFRTLCQSLNWHFI